MTTDKKKLLVTSALPYANGSIHLGHLLEHIQTDIWVRKQRLQGHECYSVCADDAHGTPVMLRAQELGLTPEEMVAQTRAEHDRDLRTFLVCYDNYYVTHSPENEHFCGLIYQRLQEQGYIFTKTIDQLYDPEKQMFLPDRFVKGTCPKCAAEDQNGDSCDKCGATYSPTELVDPQSVVSGATPVLKASEHYFFDLPQFNQLLTDWVNSDAVQEDMRKKLMEWFDAGLQAWDISRDAPYFGFKIPGTEDKFFYVWVDAPVGYMASFENYCTQHTGPDAPNFDSFWAANSDAELHHFIGKDITYFHCLFWPAMLNGAGFRVPTKVHVHGFVTVNGAKMSKSKGTFIKASTYAEHLNIEYLRYYFASKLTPSVIDIDLNFDDFINKVNSDLVGKLVNIASRCAGFIVKKYDSTLAHNLPEQPLLAEIQQAANELSSAYDECNYSKVIKRVMQLADKANQYIDEQAPWVMAKDENKALETQQVCSVGINAFRLLMIYLTPVLPAIAEQSEQFLNDHFTWDASQRLLTGHVINKFKPLVQRVDPEHIATMVDASKRDLSAK